MGFGFGLGPNAHLRCVQILVTSVLCACVGPVGSLGEIQQNKSLEQSYSLPGDSQFASEGSAACENTCEYAFDNECDDGGPGSAYSVCALGTDCSDCGSRNGAETAGSPPASSGYEEPRYGQPDEYGTPLGGDWQTRVRGLVVDKAQEVTRTADSSGSWYAACVTSFAVTGAAVGAPVGESCALVAVGATGVSGGTASPVTVPVAAVCGVVGVTQLDSLIGGIIGGGLGLVACSVGSSYDNSRVDGVPVVNTDGDTAQCTARLQAQGGGLERSVVVNATSASVGTAGLDSLAAQLTRRQLRDRAAAFQSARNWINSRPANGGVYGHTARSFANTPGSPIRVDVEVLRGHCFHTP